VALVKGRLEAKTALITHCILGQNKASQWAMGDFLG